MSICYILELNYPLATAFRIMRVVFCAPPNFSSNSNIITYHKNARMFRGLSHIIEYMDRPQRPEMRKVDTESPEAD